MDAYIFDAVRTPRGRGKANGALHTLSPLELAATVLRALVERGRFDPAGIDEVVLGCAETVGDQGANLARSAAIMAGYGDAVPGFMVSRFCGSALDAINVGVAKVMSRQADLVVAGGVEMNSLVPMLFGTGGPSVSDVLFNDRVLQTPQGVAADLIATLEGYTRADVDAYAVESQCRAAHARRQGWFDRSIVPVVDVNGTTCLERDELIREDASLEGMAALKPSFGELGEKAGFDATVRYRYPQVERIHHVHHAGNSSAVSDGASAVLIGSAEAGRRWGLTPRARVLACASAAADPCIMLTAVVPAARKALERAGLGAHDVDLYEVNEAFAAVVLKFMSDLGVGHERVNVAGGAIALGHPVGATGGMLIGTVLDELERRGLRRGLVAMCTGLGMGVATLVERM